MGFDLTQVISDDKHYGAFVCKICESLVSLDAVVTIACSHPFCRECMTEWAKKQIDNRMPCFCPKCDVDLASTNINTTGNYTTTPTQNGTTNNVNGNNTHNGSSSTTFLQLGDTSIMVQPLGEAQPLALEVLKMIQVACIGGENSRDCEWTGDYGSWKQHHQSQHDDEDIVGSTAGLTINSTTTRAAHLHHQRGPLDKQQYARSLSMPSLFGTKKSTTALAAAATATGTQQTNHQTANIEIEGPFNVPAGTSNNELEHVPENGEGQPITGTEQKPLVSPRMKLQRGLSGRMARQNSQKRNFLKQFKRQYKSVSDLGKPMDESIMSMPEREANHHNYTELINGAKHKSELPESYELEMSYGDMDWNESIGSMPAYDKEQGSPSKKAAAFAAVDEDKSHEFILDMEEDEEHSGAEAGEGGESSAKAIERSEKLKKQANAKFNKGDFEGARALYTDGLNVITGIITVSKEECELVATLFSNRAVTFFREKNFAKCIEDCDKALEYEPTFEKSYIRKWRALMALGNFEEACECLEEAHRQIPSSQRIKQELAKAREQKEVLSVVNTMIDGGNLEKAKETIKPLAKESDNIGLLLVAAMADAGLGLTESALEKVNKALRFNPNHAEALQLRGLVLFLSGEMDKGVRLLQELHNRHPDSAEIQMKLDQCQTTLSAFSKGRGYAKRGRYKDAVEQFTFAMEEKALPLPSGTALYCLIKIERAEALLLSKHYAEALKDCKDALESQPENAEAWALKAEIYMCLGRAAEAKIELAEIRQTWGSDNLVIEDAYRKASFEEKVRRVDDELMQLINDVEAGVPEKVIIDGRDGSREQKAGGMHQSERRYGSSDRRSNMDKRAKSYRSLNKGNDKDRKSERNRKEKHADKRSKRDRDRVRSTPGEGSGRTLGTQTSARTLNTNATGISSRTLKTHGTNGASHRAKRVTRKKSSRALKVEKG